MVKKDDRSGRISKISPEALETKTGQSWSSWFEILDGVEATRMSHAEIAKYLTENFQIGGWWSQTITVEYERTRGLRKKHQMQDGFAISRSRTIGVPLADLYAAWLDAEARRRWLETNRMEIRKSTTNKSMRIDWQNPESLLDVYFYAKGDHKSQVVVQQSKLASEADAVKMKTYWSDRLTALKQLLEVE